ncbi:MAG: electron transfer flavoprotein subunit alpha/FixB family protein [Acidimicrobiales bacterium]|jgi:electron transfer flavoprotein alpha subunit
MSVLCLVEHDGDDPIDASLRALSFARDLAGSAGEELAAAVVGGVSASELETLGSFGVSQAYSIEAFELDSYAPIAWARALVDLASSTPTSAVVAAGTDRGNEVMAHVGALSGLPMAANCLRATRRGETTVALSRQRWAGSLIEDAVLESTIALFTVAFDGVAPEPAPTPAAPGLEVYRPLLSEADLGVKVSDWTQLSAGISLAEARVVIGGGRGVGSAEDFGAIEELAGLLGAAVGVSRAVTSAGWRPHSQQVGQTGTRISPELYLACGISGAIQHLAGCQSAKCLVAVNTDPEAPIISRADYAVIGDLNVIIPALVTAIRQRGARAIEPPG